MNFMNAIRFSAIAAVSAFATEGSRIATEITPESFADNSSDSKTASLYIWMGSGSWSTSLPYCSATRAYIRTEDKNMQAAFLTFWTMGKEITLTVDDSKPKKDGGCQVVSIKGE